MSKQYYPQKIDYIEVRIDFESIKLETIQNKTWEVEYVSVFDPITDSMLYKAVKETVN